LDQDGARQYTELGSPSQEDGVESWYYRTADVEQGPVDEGSLKALLANGTLTLDTPVRKEGREEWRPASDMHELADVVPMGGAGAPVEPHDTPAEDSASSEVALAELVKPHARVQRMLWFAFIYSLFAYAFFVWFMGSREGVEPAPIEGRVVAGVAVVAVISAALGLFFRRKTFGDVGMRKALQGLASSPVEFGQGQSPPSEERRLKYAELSAGDKAVYQLTRQAFTGWIICLAFFEAVALLGVFLGFTSKDVSMTLPFVVTAIALDVTVFPRVDRFIARARRLL
jgi:hypothetical protein